MISRTSLTLVLEAPSISITSSEAPRAISWQLAHTPQGFSVGPFSQFSALARILATDVYRRPGTGKQIRMRNAALAKGARQGCGNELLPDQFGEVLGRFRVAVTSYAICEGLRAAGKSGRP